jgi:membrane protein YdbS with pleckstrin-like domain
MRTINIGQFYGGLVGAAVWIFVAIWYLYFWPRSLRGQIDRGDIDPFDGLAKLRKAPLFGYFFLLLAIADTIGTLDYVGSFGSVWVSVVLLCPVVISMFIVVRRIRRQHANQVKHQTDLTNR